MKPRAHAGRQLGCGPAALLVAMRCVCAGCDEVAFKQKQASVRICKEKASFEDLLRKADLPCLVLFACGNTFCGPSVIVRRRRALHFLDSVARLIFATMRYCFFGKVFCTGNGRGEGSLWRAFFRCRETDLGIRHRTTLVFFAFVTLYCLVPSWMLMFACFFVGCHPPCASAALRVGCVRACLMMSSKSH